MQDLQLLDRRQSAGSKLGGATRAEVPRADAAAIADACAARQWSQSIRSHEQGSRHQMNKRQAMHDAEKKRRDNAIQRSQARKQMEEIERAALAAYQVDRSHFGGGAAATAAGRPPPPPPPRRAKAEPPRRRRDADRGRPGGKGDEEDEDGADAPPTEREMLPEGEAPGQYAVQGTVFLEGHMYEDKLAVGRACEVFLESVGRDGDWCPGHIASKRVLAVPNTSLVVRRYRVALTGGGETPEVLADEIRIRAPSPPDAVAEEDQEGEGGGEGSAVPSGGGTEEDFFFGGGWQTVSVREVDEAAEEKRRRQELASIEASRSEGLLGATNVVQLERQQQQQQQRVERDAGAVPAVLGEGEDDEDDAFRAFNPFGGAYKGVAVTNSSAMERFDGSFRHEEEVARDEPPPPAKARPVKVVSFKKKRKAGTGKQLRRKR